MTLPRFSRALIVSALVVVNVVAALSVTSSAGAATPCGKKVLGDWFDNGRIDRLYPLHCYEDAIDAIPADIRDYADAQDVISRALQSALRGKLSPYSSDDPSPNGSGSGNSAGHGGSDGADASGGSPQAAPTVDTSSPSSVPIPLLVLGGISIALLAAGGLGYVSRRRHAANGDDLGDDDTLV